MKCLIVIAHPLATSLCHALSAVARQALSSGGHEIVVADLYAEGFDPVLTAAERKNHYGQPDHEAAEAQRLMAAEVIVLVFPTWWYGLPAILKGWFDRVWLPGIAFDLAPGTPALKPRLAALKHVVAITTLGSPRWADWLILRQPVRRILRHAITGTCAPHARFHYLAQYSAETLSSRQFEAFAARIQRTLAGL